MHRFIKSVNFLDSVMITSKRSEYTTKMQVALVKCLKLSDYLSLEVLCVIDCIVISMWRSKGVAV